ncbi:hypothetical protein PanWU01x14_164460 [Parasponia andersonii]|uniref:Uncharacterized protein n=1 Tax=Parasponia andersonii TaxID=3476 RepID=A0A2P5CCC5_PARAD|nr:hypothetical protein PanWU01x14_164460 [Parasponia andersonii]
MADIFNVDISTLIDDSILANYDVSIFISSVFIKEEVRGLSTFKVIQEDADENHGANRTDVGSNIPDVQKEGESDLIIKRRTQETKLLFLMFLG